ncbi:2Fe-2S iron-sulfur cluster-binding protein [Kineobactrum salinum]|uniref:FAD-dependent oxidoreductase n=1 Tax=Kineobactrum salinum TaxID=2708301 RepID=A0A6C0U4P4_9GAMM|nr:2Fe-2S iron-sulfur cluster-binding protein [Kineobactrum salinum]QIB67071.1 FAD-dependent oxidoreductase [Kineobactrum salinum]
MKKTGQRLPHARVDTTRAVDFQFDGRRYRGFHGDTLASALLANGVGVVGRSFKLHRPRGVFGAAREETNALIQLESGGYTEPNARATLVPLYQGLEARGQNAWPSVRFDLFGLIGLCKRLLPASFYYKTFMWPSWHSWEWLVRRVAGLGKAPAISDPHTYIKQNVHADIVVVGAGRSGLQAALTAAADPDCRVLLIDEQEEPGGTLLASPAGEDRQWLAEAMSSIAALDNVTLLSRTTVNGYYDSNVLAALERVTHHLGPVTSEQPRERFWRIFAGRVVLATGAIERPLVFPHNDRPGIMLASAVREYTHRYGLTLGERVVFYSNNDSAWRTALELAEAGVPVAAIVDIRASVEPALQQRAQDAGIIQRLGTAVTHTRGRHGVRTLVLHSLAANGQSLEASAGTLDCDLLAMSGGWTPTIHLYSQAGGQLDFREDDACFVPARVHQAVTVVGRANGDFREPLNVLPQWLTPGVSPEHQWIDFQYDVTASDIQLAARENFVSVEHVKRYTTNGMSVDQGKTSNVNGLGVLAKATGRPIADVGTTRFRPPYHPTTLGAYAGVALGELYQPYQLLPAHEAHLAAGAAFEDYGAWKRPACYPRSGEDEAAAMAREATAVRKGVGLLDYSPLGKLEVHGPDAREFLNRVYLNNVQTLKVGAARYGLMLNEAGIVIDDGIMVCLAEQHFLLHTTSGGATTIHQHLEEWLQCEWPELQVIVSNATTQWATLMLSGPQARAVLQTLPSDIDLAREAFGHMQYREGTLDDVPCRILRASFTGEVSFEISVPARHGLDLWHRLMAAGEAFDIIPFGIESLMLLRTEKGYLHVGSDTDGNTMPQDLGWAGAVEKKSADFIGRRTLSQDVGKATDRFQFTGIELLEPKEHIVSGAHVLTADGTSTAGYVTSAVFSPNLGRTVALGIVAGAREREGDQVTIFYGGKTRPARLVKPCAYDPAGEALNG